MAFLDDFTLAEIKILQMYICSMFNFMVEVCMNFFEDHCQ